MSRERFFKHPELPFAECRYSSGSERRYKLHMHKTFCVGAIDRGEVLYRVGDQVASLRPGSLALINPETLHACNPGEGEKRSYYVLYLDARWCRKLRPPLWPGEALLPADAALLEDEALYRRYIAAMEALMAEGPLQEKEGILVELIRAVFARAGCSAAAPAGSPEEVGRMKLLLDTELDREISAEDIARKLHANPYTLLRKFKASTGITPHAYRVNCRIERARRLLQKGWEPSRVALECGFFDQSHLNRHFKALTAVTPGEYRVNFVQ
jgi:AraC-like DNA-binding protein